MLAVLKLNSTDQNKSKNNKERKTTILYKSCKEQNFKQKPIWLYNGLVK